MVHNGGLIDSSLFPLSGRYEAIALSASKVAIGCAAMIERLQIIDVNAASGSQAVTTGTEQSTSRYLQGNVNLSDGRVVYLGGTGNGSNRISNVDIYDPSLDQWNAGDPFPSDARYFAYNNAIVMPDDRVVVLSGGETDSNFVLSNFIYNPNQTQGNQWAALDAFATQKVLQGSARVGLTNHNILECGGMDLNTSAILNTCRIIDINATTGSHTHCSRFIKSCPMNSSSTYLVTERQSISLKWFNKRYKS